MSNIKQIRICGLGGQGIVLMGTILGNAGVMDGKFVSGSNAYGSQARGGLTRSEVVVSEKPILFPHVITADTLIAFCQEAYDQYSSKVKNEKALVICESSMVEINRNSSCSQYNISSIESALSKLDSAQNANLIMLAAVNQIACIVSFESLVNATKSLISTKNQDQALKALNLGLELGRLENVG